MFDLHSLATLATARALEAGSLESSKTGPQQSFSARRIFNLRRKFSWAPRNEPVRLKLMRGDHSFKFFQFPIDIIYIEPIHYNCHLEALFRRNLSNRQI